MSKIFILEKKNLSPPKLIKKYGHMGLKKSFLNFLEQLNLKKGFYLISKS